MRPNMPAAPVRLAAPAAGRGGIELRTAPDRRGAPVGPDMAARERTLEQSTLPPARAPRSDRPSWAQGRPPQPGAPMTIYRPHPQTFTPQQRQGQEEWHVPPQRQAAPPRPAPEVRAPEQRFAPPERQVPEQRFAPPERQVPAQRFAPPERQVPEQRFTPPERRVPEQRFAPPERQIPQQRLAPPGFSRPSMPARPAAPARAPAHQPPPRADRRADAAPRGSGRFAIEHSRALG